MGTGREDGLDLDSEIDAKAVEWFGPDASILWKESHEGGASFAVMHGVGAEAAVSFGRVSMSDRALSIGVDRTLRVEELSALARERGSRKLDEEIEGSLDVLFRGVQAMIGVDSGDVASLAWTEIGEGMVAAVRGALESAGKGLPISVSVENLRDLDPPASGLRPVEVPTELLATLARQYVSELHRVTSGIYWIDERGREKLVNALCSGLHRYVQIEALHASETIKPFGA